MKTSTVIPFHRSDITELEIEAITRALLAGHLTGDGPETRQVQAWMSEKFGAKHVLLTPSCTNAMELALMAAEVGPGDEVILPSFTFASTANAVVLQGARPVFAEIELETLTLDPEDVERRITSHTRAVMPVHYAGVSAHMDEIIRIAERHNLLVIEDAAQGVGARYKDKYLGTIGHLGAYSFHGTKNFTCGEGGAFLTNDDEFFHRAEIIREKGTNRQEFLRGEVDKYTWVDRGSSFLLSDVLAALIGVQLSRMEELISARKRVHECYQAGLRPLENSGLISLLVIPEGYESNYHIYYFMVRNQEERDRLLARLRANGISATFHYIPLHSSPFARKVLGCEDELPLTERASASLIRLPIFPSLSESDIERIIFEVTSIVSKF